MERQATREIAIGNFPLVSETSDTNRQTIPRRVPGSSSSLARSFRKRCRSAKCRHRHLNRVRRNIDARRAQLHPSQRKTHRMSSHIVLSIRGTCRAALIIARAGKMKRKRNASDGGDLVDAATSRGAHIVASSYWGVTDLALRATTTVLAAAVVVCRSRRVVSRLTPTIPTTKSTAALSSRR